MRIWKTTENIGHWALDIGYWTWECLIGNYDLARRWRCEWNHLLSANVKRCQNHGRSDGIASQLFTGLSYSVRPIPCFDFDDWQHDTCNWRYSTIFNGIQQHWSLVIWHSIFELGLLTLMIIDDGVPVNSATYPVDAHQQGNISTQPDKHTAHPPIEFGMLVILGISSRIRMGLLLWTFTTVSLR